MLTLRRGEFPHQSFHPSWPQKLFNTRRQFDRKTENQPYIEWLLYDFDDGDGSSEEEGEEEVEEDVVDDSTEEETDLTDVPIEGLDDEDGDQKKAEIRADEKSSDPYKGQSTVRFFMKGMTDEERLLQYSDQVDVVANFFEQCKCGKPEGHVALLDNGKFFGTSSVKRNNFRPYLKALTSEQLREELGKQRFNVKSDQNYSSDLFQGDASDIERRILFFTDLDTSTMETLAVTAPRSHAQALKNLLYKYLRGKTSIGVSVPSQGFKIFTFDFHASYFVLKESKQLLQDERQGPDSRPLRQSLELPFLSGPLGASPSTGGIQCLYEAQMSVTLTGIDHWIWTAYGIFDTYFGSKESIEAYLQTQSRTGRPDPLFAGQIPSHSLIWTPREYFIKVLEIRMNEVGRHWQLIVDTVEHEIKQKNFVIPLVSIGSNTRQEVQDLSAWSTQMVDLLRKLISRLSDTVSSWDNFKRKDIYYFLYEDEFPTTSEHLQSSIHAVDDTFENLRNLLKKLEQFQTELCQNSPQGLNAHYNHGNHEAQIFQQKSAFHIQVLTVITILFLPPALAAAIFSTQGVLPFTPNLARFTYVLFILGVFVLVSIVVLYKWNSWFQLIVDCISRRPWKIDAPKQLDLEKGAENGMDNLQ